MTRFRSLWPMHPPMHWCIPHVAEPGPLWNAASWVILKMVGGSSRLFMNNFADLRVINKEVLMKAIDERPPGVPLLTVCNHMSVLDDPMLWGMLPLSYFRPGKVRWTIAAEDICFMRKIYALIFGLGQVFPVRRGAGVVQWPVTDFAVDMLNKGQWVHIFPEGKINPLKNVYRMKWGVGEMIAQSRVPPIVLPFWHEGMEDVMPDDNSPRIPRPFKKSDRSGW
eukprot:Opistho-2@14064